MEQKAIEIVALIIVYGAFRRKMMIFWEAVQL